MITVRWTGMQDVIVCRVVHLEDHLVGVSHQHRPPAGAANACQDIGDTRALDLSRKIGPTIEQPILDGIYTTG